MVLVPLAIAAAVKRFKRTKSDVVGTVSVGVTRGDVETITDYWDFMEGDGPEIKTRAFIPSREAFCSGEEGAIIKIVFLTPEEGGNMIDEGDYTEKHLTFPALMGGIQKYVDKRGGKWTPEDYDAQDYDCMVQIALFGKIVIS